METHLILVFAVVGLVTTVVEASLFHYHASVWTGTSVSTTASSQWSIKAKVLIEQDLVQLSRAEVSVYSGASAGELNYGPLPAEASQLEQPFSLRYDERKLVGLSVVPGEDVWAVNMKRGLAALLQLDQQVALSPVLQAEENLLHGLCIADYTSYLQENVTVVRKFVDHETCREFPWKTIGQCVPVLCSQNPKAPVRSSTDATYRVHVHEGELELQSVVATSRTVFHLLLSSASHVIVVNQSLEREYEENPAPLIHIPENMTQVGIMFELPSNDPTQGRDPADQQYIYNKVTHILKELSKDLDYLQVGADPDEHHKNLIASAIDFLYLAEIPTLQKLFSSFDLGTSYQQETVRNIFLDILPKVGTHDSALVIRDLIVDEKVRNATAINFLTYLPFYIREPTEDLLADMEALLTATKDFSYDLKSAVMLSFSNLVGKTCKKSCKPEVLDTYILYFLNHFTASKEYQDQLLYLDALSNIEIGRVFDYLVSIVRGNATLHSAQPDYLRYRAMWALASRASFHSVEVRELCWPILSNKSESLDLRVAALTTLTLSDPTPGMFHNLFSYMQLEVDHHLYYHYYTTLQSLADSTFPCYKELGSLAQEVLPVARKPAVELWGSGNYILDFSDTHFQFGSLAHLLLIANKQTGLPSVFHLFLGAHTSDYITKRTDVFLRIEGVAAPVKEKLLQSMHLASSIPQLMDMLAKLNMTPVADEHLHIELAVNLHGSTVLSQYANSSNWKEFLTELWALMTTELGAHVNSQESNVLLMNGNYFPTSAGTLAFMRTQRVDLTSLRGDVSRKNADLRTDLDISVFHSIVYELLTFNPILNVWQAADTSHTVRGHLIINNHFSMEAPLSFKLSIYQPTGSSAGLVLHKRTSVSVKGSEVDRTLRGLCPTCEMAVDVITGNKDKKTKQLVNIQIPDIGSRLQVHVLKCDTCPSDGSVTSMLLSALDRNSKNCRFLPSICPFLSLLHLVAHAIVVPPEDITGYSVQVVSTHNQLTELQLSTQLDVVGFLETSGNGPLYAHTLLAHKMLHSNTSLWAWKITSQLNFPMESDTYSINAELLKTAAGESPYSVCLQLDSKLHKYDKLSVRNLLSNVLVTQGSMSWGDVGNDTESCSDSDGRLYIMTKAQASDEQKELATVADKWPFNTCPAHAEGTTGNEGDWLFLDPACSQVITALSTPRKVTSVIMFRSERYEQLFNSLFGLTSDSEPKNLTITAEFPVSKKEVELTFNDYHMASSTAATFALPMLSYGLLPAADSILIDNAYTCVINVSNVWTFDSAFMDAAVPTCYILGSAERAQDPHFAIMVRKLSSNNELGLKIYAGSDYIEIISRNGCATISANDDWVYAEEKFKTVHNFGLSKNKRGDTTIVAPPAVVIYKISSVTIIMPLLQGHLVGLCGDHNADPSNDHDVHSITTTCLLE